MDNKFKLGQRVLTPQGTGRIRYIQYSAPEYINPTHINVILDRHSSNFSYNGEDPNYAGIMFSADQVKETNENIIVWGY